MARKGSSDKDKVNCCASGCLGNENLKDEISKLAQNIYEKSGKKEGLDLENWLKAEKQVMAKIKNVC